MWAISKYRTSPSGFTLVELMVVVAVIGILAAVTVVVYRGMQDRARGTAMNTASEQWAESIEVQFVKSPPSTRMNGGWGRKGCLGTSAADFPAQDGFGAGRCIDFVNIPGHTDTQADDLAWFGEKYVDELYTDDGWWSNKRGVFNGLIASPAEMTFSNGARMKQRGVIAWVEPDAGNFWTHRDRIRLLWVVPSSVACSQGTDFTDDWFTNSIKKLYTAQFSSSTTVTSGKMCIRDMSFD